MTVNKTKVVTTVKYFCRSRGYDLFNEETRKYDKYKVLGAYPIELGSSEKAAYDWAVQFNSLGYLNKDEPIIFQSNNDLISSVFVLGLEHRGNGGRAYKISFSIFDQLTNSMVDDICTDFREDVLLDAIQNSTVDRGIVYGPFVWIKNGAQMKLVRENSLQHKLALKKK